MPFEPKMIPTQVTESGMEGGEGTYNSGVMPRLYNKIVMLLSAIGIFIAGVLTYSEYGNKEVPCGGDGGCSAVTTSVFSKIGPIPVAVLGLLGYVTFLALAYLRSGSVGEKWEKLSKIGFWMAMAGFGFSLWLQIVSITQLGQLCQWCLASALVMFLMFLAHGLLVQAPVPETEAGPMDWVFVPVLAVLALGGIGVQAAGMTSARAITMPLDFKGVMAADIIPGAERVKGNADAKVTLVEFADMNCGLCRTMYPELHNLHRQYGGKLRIGYRHFPLFSIPGHETSTLLAMAAEYAADQGKYYEFLDLVFDPGNESRVKNPSGVYGIAEQIGLDVADMKLKMDVKKDATYLDKVTEDYTMAKDELKMQGTPTFILIGEGMEPEVVSHTALEATLRSPKYAELLK